MNELLSDYSSNLKSIMFKYDRYKLKIKNAIPRKAWNYYIDAKENHRLNKLRYIQPDRNRYSIRPFDQHKAIFIHIPKVAGMSISTSLFGCLGGGHAKLKNYRAVYKEELDNYYTFTFVRNPWDRLYSAYMFLSQSGNTYNDILVKHEIIDKYRSFEDFVLRYMDHDSIYRILHLIPQSEYILENDSTENLNYIGRYENIDEDFHIICNNLGIVRKQLIEVNITKIKNDYRKAYTNEMIEKVYDLYKKDIQILGYSF